MPPTRRDAITAGGLFGLGQVTPSRFPYPGRPQPAPGIGPSQGQVVRARQVIVSGAGGGVFIYSGTPRLGTLILSMTGIGGVDPYGNHYLGGDIRYVGVAGSHATQAFGFDTTITGIAWYSWSGSAWIIGQEIFASGTGLVVNCPVTMTSGTEATPTVVTTDTWQQVAVFQNGWVANGNLDYRLAAMDSIEIAGRVTNAAGTGGGSIITTLPAGYRPLNRVEFISLTDTNGTAHSLQVDTAGHLQLNVGIAAAGGVDISWIFPRSAPA